MLCIDASAAKAIQETAGETLYTVLTFDHELKPHLVGENELDLKNYTAINAGPITVHVLNRHLWDVRNLSITTR